MTSNVDIRIPGSGQLGQAKTEERGRKKDDCAVPGRASHS